MADLNGDGVTDVVGVNQPSGQINVALGVASPLPTLTSVSPTYQLLAPSNATLTLTNVQAAQEGVYNVMVSNEVGSMLMESSL